MVQIAAALFFVVALLAPLAVVTMTLHSNWRAIVRALGGHVLEDRLPASRQPRIRPMARSGVRRSHGRRVAA